MNIKKYIKNIDYYKKIIFIGMIINILWVLFIDTKPIYDFKYYNELATSISKGGNFGDTYTSVGYAIILGYIYKFFGAHIIVAKIFNLVLTTANYFIFYNIIKKLNLNDKLKKYIFTLFVFFPSNIFYNSILATEILFTTILFLITKLIFDKNATKKYFIIGILTGINTMIKPFFILFPLVVFLFEIIVYKKLKDSLKKSLIIVFVACIVIAPLIYRNTKLIGQFTGVSNNGGIVLYINNNSQNKYGRWIDAKKVENSIVLTEKYKRANMTEKNKMLTKAAKKWIINHPIDFTALAVKRLVATYILGDDVIYSFQGTSLGKYATIPFGEYKSLFLKDGVGYEYYLLAILVILTNIIRNIVFIPALICIYIASIKIFIKIIKRKTSSINKFELYSIILFHMFTCVYFITEGQGRYAFPVTFILIYYFAKIIMRKRDNNLI